MSEHVITWIDKGYRQLNTNAACTFSKANSR